MIQDVILQELQKNKKNQKIGSEVFNISIDKNNIKPGLPVKDIIRKMRKGSKENLFSNPTNANFC